MALGYGVMLTPLQILTYYNAVANNGELLMPRFVSAVKKLDGKKVKSYPKQVINPAICSQETLGKLQKLMEGVVKNKWGTAHNIYDEKLAIAGKTGTCQIDYTTDDVKYVSSFVGYFPAQNPTYSCIAVIHKPNKKIGYYGNVVAAPVVKQIAEAVIHDIPKNTLLNLNKVVELRSTLPNTTNAHDIDKMPNMYGWPAMDAVTVLESLGIEVVLKGKGKVRRQSQRPGKALGKTKKVTLTLS